MPRARHSPTGRLKQPAGPALMDRTRASVCLLDKRTQMFAFLSLFHPELSLTERLKLANHAGEED